MKSVLVTGANGFVGRHLVPFLIEQGVCVKAVVRSESRAQMLPAEVEPIVVGEINGKTNWDFALSNVQAVIHLAGLSSSSQKIAETDYYRINVEGTTHLAKEATKYGVKHFIFISSIHAVAFLSNEAITEKTPHHPHSQYGHSKYQAEKALLDALKGSGTKWTIIRSVPIYGVGHKGNLDRLIRLVRSGLPLPFSRVNNLRSVVYVDNLCDVLFKIVANPKAFNQVFLVSDQEALSTPQLMELIAQVMGRRSFLFPAPIGCLRFLGVLGDFFNQAGIRVPFSSNLVNGLLGSLYCDCDHIKKTLNWHPPVSTAEGLKLTIQGSQNGNL